MVTTAGRKYPGGSEWRKWDLHVHTPYSALNNGFGDDFPAYASSLLTQAVEQHIAVIGVTDYFLIDGYLALRELLTDHDRLNDLLGEPIATRAREIAILPNIEFRSPIVIADGDAGRINFHVLFDPDLDPRLIEDHFLRQLKFTAQSDPFNPDERWPVTRQDLAALGKRLKEEHPPFQSKSDLVVGMTSAVVTHESVTEALQEQASRFGNRYLFVVPEGEDLSQISWDGQGHQTRKLYIQKAHMLFSGNPGTRDFGLGKRHPSEEAFKAEFRSLKPCIHGSDAHTVEKLFEPDLKRYLWIKGDPTFQGLRQLLFEPALRVFIGEEPSILSKVDERATKYMDAVGFERSTKARDEIQWFSGRIPLNHGLIAIIGNKGSGKSALSDILGLLGETRNAEYFSFLKEDRFLARKAGLGEMFAAEVEWHSGLTQRHLLADPVDLRAPELVKYIPQGFLETICSELQESGDTEFDHELMDVIFSHVDDADKLGKDTLRDLIDYVTSETAELLEQLHLRLVQINHDILGLDSQLTPEHRKTLEGQLVRRQADLQAHLAAEPEPVMEPAVDPEVQEKRSSGKEELDSLVSQIEALDQQIEAANQASRRAALRAAAADRLLDRIANLVRQVEGFHDQSADDAKILELDTRSLIKLIIDRVPVTTAQTDARKATAAAKELLSDKDGSLLQQRKELVSRTDAARAKLDEPARRYEEYLRNRAGWAKRRDEIEGSNSTTGSVKWLEAKIQALADLPTLIEERKSQRLAVVKDIFEAKERLLARYRALYAPVQEFIDNHPVAQQGTTLEFSASIMIDDFSDVLLNMIHQGRRGSFRGDPEGRQILEDLLAISDFSSYEGVVGFLGAMEEHLTKDKSPGGDDAAVRVADQLRQDFQPSDIYDMVFGLRYLIPRFELLWQGKPINQLSPGERGNLLLVFYLLIDRRDDPLIIDQPEENLDNHTIATALIPAVRHAKERRQIVIVTHNPNLAVVCDAEQIIHAKIDKTAGNRVFYTSGSIEDPEIAKMVVDVLEGTKPAFDKRGAKYDVLERLDVTAT